MKTIIEALKTFIDTRMNYITNGDGLTISILTNDSLVIRGSKDERIGDWVECYKTDLEDFGKTNNADVSVIVEMSEEIDSEAFVYVLIAKKGDKSGLDEIKKIEEGREGVYIFPISELPCLRNFTNHSALNDYILWNSSVVLEVKEL